MCYPNVVLPRFLAKSNNEDINDTTSVLITKLQQIVTNQKGFIVELFNLIGTVTPEISYYTDFNKLSSILTHINNLIV